MEKLSLSVESEKHVIVSDANAGNENSEVTTPEGEEVNKDLQPGEKEGEKLQNIEENSKSKENTTEKKKTENEKTENEKTENEKTESIEETLITIEGEEGLSPSGSGGTPIMPLDGDDSIELPYVPIEEILEN